MGVGLEDGEGSMRVGLEDGEGNLEVERQKNVFAEVDDSTTEDEAIEREAQEKLHTCIYCTCTITLIHSLLYMYMHCFYGNITRYRGTENMRME